MTKTERAIKLLQESLKDQDYRYGWESNIAMSYVDAEYSYRRQFKKVGKYLNMSDKHIIANMGANIFIDRLCDDTEGAKDHPSDRFLKFTKDFVKNALKK